MARKTKIVFEPADINNLLEKLTALLSETFPRIIELSLNLDPELPPIMVDPNQINQAIINLCVNARDAMPQGGRLLLATRITTGHELRKQFQNVKDDRYVCISVTDTGLGMDEATKSLRGLRNCDKP